MNKAETISAVQSTHDQLVAAIAGVPDDLMIKPGATGQWSIKDILAHITFWEQRMISGYQKLVRHEPVDSLTVPDGDTRQMAIDRLNEGNYQSKKDRSLDDIRQEFDRSYQQVLTTLQDLSDAEYGEASETAKTLGEPVSAFFAGDSYDHYPEHTATILNWLNSRGGEVF